MTRLLPFFILLSLSLCLAACEQKNKTAESPKNTAEKAPPPPGPKVEACALVSDQDVAAVQKAPITSHQGNEVPTNEFLTSQCYYTSSEPSCSVTIAVIQRDPAQTVTRSIHQFWDDAFGRFREAEARKSGDREEVEREQAEKGKASEKGEEEEEKEKQHAEKVAGVGEEAFWSTNAVGGIFYALEGEKIVRVSVGGPSKMEEKLEKSKTLAQKAIGALPK